MSSMRVVFSMDLIITRFLGVMGEFASLRGLKFKMALMILGAIDGRARIRRERQLRVESTKTASLYLGISISSKWMGD